MRFFLIFTRQIVLFCARTKNHATLNFVFAVVSEIKNRFLCLTFTLACWPMLKPVGCKYTQCKASNKKRAQQSFQSSRRTQYQRNTIIFGVVFENASDADTKYGNAMIQQCGAIRLSSKHRRARR